MSARLPEFVDPWLLADRGRVIGGELDLAGLPRIAELLLDAKGVVRFELNFQKDAKSRVRITGSVQSRLALECQRCLEMMTLPVDARLDLVVIQVPAEAERIPEECEPVVAEDGALRIVDLVEEELLLAIPLVPMHAQEVCSIRTSGGDENEQMGDQEERNTENPFAILSSLKADKQN